MPEDHTAEPYRLGHEPDAFHLPQKTSDGKHEAQTEKQQQSWSPRFVDYVFLAFKTSTALSPTDTPVYDRWAKVLMMIQSLISLTVTGSR